MRPASHRRVPAIFFTGYNVQQQLVDQEFLQQHSFVVRSGCLVSGRAHTGVSLVSSTRVQKKTFADVATIDDLYAWMLGPFFAYVVRPWCLLTTAMRVAMPSPDAHGRWCCHAAATGRCTRRRL